MISLTEGHKLLVADCDNHRLQLASHLDKRNRYYQTLGGFGVAPSNGLQRPTGLAVSASGDALYLSDSHNHRIQHRSWPEFKVLRTTGSYGAKAGQLNFPSAIALAEGRLYVADTSEGAIGCTPVSRPARKAHAATGAEYRMEVSLARRTCCGLIAPSRMTTTSSCAT